MQMVGRAEASGQLPDREYQNIAMRVTAAARGSRIAEQVFPTRQLPGGEDALGYSKDTIFELAKRGASHPGPIRSTVLGRVEDTVGLTPSHVNLQFIYDGFFVGPEVLAASRLTWGQTGGGSIDLRAAQTIGIEVQEAMETDLFKGTTTPYTITGFDAGATDGGASGGAWSTRANIIIDVTTLMSTLRDTGGYNGPRWMIVSGALMTDLIILENDYTDRVVYDTLTRLFPLGIFEVAKAFFSATDTALVGCPGPGTPEADVTNFEIARAMPLTTWTAADEFGKGVKGLIFTKASPRIYQSAALVEIDNITA